MSRELEDTLRTATPPAPGELDLDDLHRRAAARLRARGRRRAVGASIGLVAVIALIASVVALRDDHSEPPRRVDSSGPPVTWTRVPGIAGVVFDAVTGRGVTVAVGNTAQQGAVWVSDDGTHWDLVYQRQPASEEDCQQKVCVAAPVTSTLSQVTYASGRFVVIGGTSSTASGGNRGFALTSTDGRSWIEADTSAFAPVETPRSNLATVVRGLAHFGESFVAVGDVYTANKRQQDGLSPALWRSPDGTHWTLRVLRLGDGFDPYMDGLALEGDRLVAGGGYEHGFGAWTTHDLRHWSFHLIARRGGQGIVAVPQGFVAAGGTCVPAKLCSQRRPKHQPRSRPTLWFSPDAEHWRVVLRLPAGAESDSRFRVVGVVGGRLVALGIRTPVAGNARTLPLVYVSTDGRTWTEDRDANLFPDGTSFASGGRRGSAFLVFGLQPSDEWIVTP